MTRLVHVVESQGGLSTSAPTNRSNSNEMIGTIDKPRALRIITDLNSGKSDVYVSMSMLPQII
jgi:hypothetical protein